jgi:hypothetical protein
MICGASRNITDHKLWMRTRGGGTQKQGRIPTVLYVLYHQHAPANYMDGGPL